MLLLQLRLKQFNLLLQTSISSLLLILRLPHPFIVLLQRSNPFIRNRELWRIMLVRLLHLVQLLRSHLDLSLQSLDTPSQDLVLFDQCSILFSELRCLLLQLLPSGFRLLPSLDHFFGRLLHSFRVRLKSRLVVLALLYLLLQEVVLFAQILDHGVLLF